MNYGTIDTKVLKILLSSKTPIILLDARGPAWDDGARIGNAKTLLADASEEQARALIPSKDCLIVVYCSNLQCPASQYLAHRLLELGYHNILKYAEGIAGWN